MTRLLDVNLLMALLWENHEHHIWARSWFKNVSAFATCPVVQLGFARVSSHPLMGYGLTPELAFGVLRQFIADPRHEFIPDDLSCTDRVVRTELMAGANQITDRYLVALARQHGFSLATLDQPLAKSFASETSLVELVH
ncbi:MAG TPA: TA system VapC family ribonuclease toxin [Verrucomicrobiae bacterium]|nr:TA system VapC family ribonuclease toxin [Verrucomicrobiae bacterium]